MKNTVLMFCVLPISDSEKLLNFFFDCVVSTNFEWFHEGPVQMVICLTKIYNFSHG